ncbi:MAG: hypothetical protein V1800_09580 [Candidatus Latescibacterota bacterium]
MMGNRLSKEHIAALNRCRRVIINYDALAAVIGLPDIEGEQLIERLFDSVDAENSPIDSVWWNWSEGNHTLYPSKVLPPIDVPRYLDWAASGFNIVQVCLEETRRRNKEAFLTYRLNGSDNDTVDGVPVVSPMKKAHPEWLIHTWDEVGYAAPFWNFAVPGVRDHKLSILREIAEDYDFDGIDIDFARICPVLPPGHQWENRNAMSEFMRSVRTMLLEVEKRRGRPFLLSARVPENLMGCHFDGLDVETWAREQLVDIFVVGCRSFDVDIAAFRRITVGTKIKLYPCLDNDHASDGYYIPPIEVFRGVFANWRYQEADGIQTFNFANHSPLTGRSVDKSHPVVWTPPATYPPPTVPGSASDSPPVVWTLHRQIYRELGDPQGLDRKNKTFLVQRRGGGHMAPIIPDPEDWTTPRWMYCNTNMFSQLPAKLNNNGHADTLLTLMVGDDVSAAKSPVASITLRLLLSDPAAKELAEADRLEPVITGNNARYTPDHCAWNIPPAKGVEEHVEIRLNNGLLGRASVEAGWLVFSVKPPQLAVGDNLVGVHVTERSPETHEELLIEKLELHVKYQ